MSDTTPRCCSSASTTPAAPRWPPRCSTTTPPDASSSARPDPQPADQLNPAVVEAMAEIGLDISKEFPKPLTDGCRQGLRRRHHHGLRRRMPLLPRASATSTGSSTTRPDKASTPSARSATRSTPASARSSPNSSRPAKPRQLNWRTNTPRTRGRPSPPAATRTPPASAAGWRRPGSAVAAVESRRIGPEGVLQRSSRQLPSSSSIVRGIDACPASRNQPTRRRLRRSRVDTTMSLWNRLAICTRRTVLANSPLQGSNSALPVPPTSPSVRDDALRPHYQRTPHSPTDPALPTDPHHQRTPHANGPTADGRRTADGRGDCPGQR